MNKNLLMSLFLILALSLAWDAAAGKISYIDLSRGAESLDSTGKFIFGYDFGFPDESSNQIIGDIRFVRIHQTGSYPYCRITRGLFHLMPWGKEYFMPPIKSGDPLEKILIDLVYRAPLFTLCHLTPGNEYKLQILIRHSPDQNNKRRLRILFNDGDAEDTTPELDQANGSSIPGLDLPAAQWAAAIVYEWKALTDTLTIDVSSTEAHIYGMTLEDLSGGHKKMENPVCNEEKTKIPETFPHFIVPGLDEDMTVLKDLFWGFYQNPIRGCTLWQDWMTYATLWPSLSAAQPETYDYRIFHRNFLLKADFDEWGCVATHQHDSYAHRDGWPFPSFEHSMGKGAGWVKGNFTGDPGWQCIGAKAEMNKDKELWNLTLTNIEAHILSPPLSFDSFNAPFLEIRWKREMKNGGDPYVEWTTDKNPEFSPSRRMYITPPENDRGKFSLVFSSLPLFRHPEWKGTITRLRFFPAPKASSGKAEINAIVTQYDTRHTINNSNFVLGCRNYFAWTGDLDFLRISLPRMRRAMRWLDTVAGGLEQGCILDPLPGHDGRPGYSGPPGKREFHPGHGIGSNYWDILPFGGFDCYSSNYYYKSILAMAEIEEAIRNHPEWNMPQGTESFDPGERNAHAQKVRNTIQRKFWDDTKGRFVGWIDADGKTWDYGFTFVNLELIESGAASEEQAKRILDWISGKRTIEGDTSTGADIYRFRLAPRATTRRNIECYQWVWQAPETLEFGCQVQDGGAVLGFSHHDLMSRLKTIGPDDAWKRLKEILDWQREVNAQGGYRAYYGKGDKGTTLQGSGTAGGIGVDCEFIESVLVPQVMLYGFLGFSAHPDGIEISPSLPSSWPSLALENINYQGIDLKIAVTRDEVKIETSCPRKESLNVSLPGDSWHSITGDVLESSRLKEGRKIFCLEIHGEKTFIFKK